MTFFMTFYDFLSARAVEGKKIERTRLTLLQNFCKKAQWRAKKLRERRSNAARPPKKGGGGLPIASIRSRFGRDSVAIRSRFGRDSVAIRSRLRRFGVPTPCRCLRRHPADTLPTPCRCLRRHPADASGDTLPMPQATPCRCRSMPKTRHKKARSPNQAIGLCASLCVAALIRRLIPHANTRASARNVR